MPLASRSYFEGASTERSTTALEEGRSRFPKFSEHFNAEPERRWQVEVIRELTKLTSMEAGWDSYDAPSVRRDAGLFALEVLQNIMRPRTPLPQVVPSSVGGVQLEWHEKGIDLEIHVAAPYDCELWFRDLQDPTGQTIETELKADFSALKKPIALLTTR